jgi:predicted heme/steroid binding protein
MFSHDPHYAKTQSWNVNTEIPTFSLVLSSSAAVGAQKHVDHYLNKGLLTRIEGVVALASWMILPVSAIKASLTEYQRDAKKGRDAWGKVTFNGVPQKDLSSEVFYAGTVTPVLHYCMGGLTIDRDGNVLDENKEIIPGLHAAGEVSGGVHGDNRLGGNSLLECTVYGTIVGKKIPIKPRNSIQLTSNIQQGGGASTKPVELRNISADELKEHNTEGDCWVVLHGLVYDLTDFADEHPAGPESITELAGQDGTEEFQAVNGENILEDFDPIGKFASL